MVLIKEEFDLLRELILRHSGIQLSPGKEYLMQTRLAPLLIEREILSYSELLRRINGGDHALLSEVIDAITTNETLWFRDDSFFTAFSREVVPWLLERAERGDVRLWSAACSTGQEPYSLAILISEAAQNRQHLLRRISILATDLSEQALTQARAAKYNQFGISRGMRQEILSRYFTQEGINYNLKDEIKNLVRFQRFNLKDPFLGMGSFDVILCRNVLIYFPDALKREICDKFHGALKKDGQLVVGAAESLRGLSTRFHALPRQGYPFYQPLDGKAPPLPSAAPSPVRPLLSPTPQGAERRRNLRLDIRLSGELVMDAGRTVRVRTRDISFGGACVAGLFPNENWSNRTGYLRLHVEGTEKDTDVEIHCRLVRSMPLGAGLRFLTINRSGFTHFKRIMVANAPDPDALLGEIRRHPGIMVGR